MPANLDIEAIRNFAELIKSLPDSLIETYKNHLPATARRSRAQQLVGEITVGLLPTVATLEVRQPYAADLLKRRLALMEAQALQLSLLEVPDFEKPRAPGVPVSEAAWEYGPFIVFCLTFGTAVHAIAAEVGGTTASEDQESSTWYKLKAPPKGEYHETPLVGTVKELTSWNRLQKAASLKNKVTKKVLWIMLEPDGRFACYFRTLAQYSAANSVRAASQAATTKKDQKRPKSHQPTKSRRKTK